MTLEKIKTSDLYYGAYLLSNGGTLLGFGMEKPGLGRRKISFEFQSPELGRLRETYLSGEAIVNLRALRSALKHLKDIVFNEPSLTLRERHKNPCTSNTTTFTP